MKILVNELTTDSRSVQTSVKLSKSSETVVVLGATRRGGGSWPEPRIAFADALYLSEEQTMLLFRAIVELFLYYKKRFPDGG